MLLIFPPLLCLDLQVEVPLPRPLLVGVIGPPLFERGAGEKFCHSRCERDSLGAGLLPDLRTGVRIAYEFSWTGPASGTEQRKISTKGLNLHGLLPLYRDLMISNRSELAHGKLSCCLAGFRWRVGPSSLEERPILRWELLTRGFLARR